MVIYQKVYPERFSFRLSSPGYKSSYFNMLKQSAVISLRRAWQRNVAAGLIVTTFDATMLMVILARVVAGVSIIVPYKAERVFVPKTGLSNTSKIWRHL
jgi:hypothetical protein